jgi:hypothetical protein
MICSRQTTTAPAEQEALPTRVPLLMLMVPLAFCPVLLSGCISGRIKPPAARVSTIRTIAVLALEPPPLGLSGREFRPGQSPTADLLKSAVLITSVPSQNVQTGGRVLASLFGILLLVEVANEVASAGAATSTESSRLEDFFSAPGVWLPTVVLADEAASQIAQPGLRTATRVKKYYRLPIANRELTWHLENWFAPVRRWYNEDTATIDYTELAPGQVDAVLEVGLDYALASFAFEGDRLLMQVMLKLIDPSTKRVLGRARNFTNRRISSAKELFSSEGEPFKRLFSDTGKQLIAEGLKDLGLLSQ